MSLEDNLDLSIRNMNKKEPIIWKIAEENRLNQRTQNAAEISLIFTFNI